MALSGDGCLRAVARKNNGFLGQGEEALAQRGDQGAVVASWQVATPYAATKKAVATEQEMFIGYIVAHAAGRVTWRRNDAQGVRSKAYFFVATNGGPQLRQLYVYAPMQEQQHLFGCTIIGTHVGGMYARRESESIIKCLCTKDMVEVAVGQQMANRRQLIILYKLNDGGLLLHCLRTTIHEDGFARVIPQHVAVLFYEIADETLDEHNK